MSHKDNDNQDKMIISDTLITSLYLAVDLIDDYTDKRPIGHVSLTMTNSDTNPIQNPSGYWLFLKSHGSENYAGNSRSIVIKSSYYFDLLHSINLESFDDPKSPIIVISLIPRPNYPFPSHATLLRGMLTNNKGKSIPNAKISVNSTDITTVSTESGEFVLYFKDLQKTFQIKENFINHNTIDIMLKILHPNYKEKNTSTQIKIGKASSSKIVMEDI